MAAAEAEAEPGPGGGGGFVGGSGGGVAGPGDEPGSGVSAGAGGGPVGERDSPQGWSLVLCMEPSAHWGSGWRGSCWGGHADEPASPTPECVA